MLLALDVGNTETTLGLFDGDQLTHHWRLTTTVQRTPDEWGAALTSYLTQAGHSTSEVRAAIVASVVPLVSHALGDGIRIAIGQAPLFVDARSKLPITLDVDEPLTVGADRIVNTLAASQVYKDDCIVVDFGTATTFDCITREGRFIGGVIMPGVVTAANELVRKTAKLPAAELSAPPHAIGRRTEDCIRSGVLFGTAEAIDGLIRRVRAEWPGGRKPRAIATGGLATLIAPLCTEIGGTDPDLTLTGLRLAAGVLGLKW
ncbi:MAG TPA: type III pantothenate kinase [Gemmatimonadales bacterium]|nr:type III pantothenate kinase [Gemmatimonadales bacterium]